MPKKAKELSAIEVKRLDRPGMHAVGTVAGLYLSVTGSGSRSWILRSMIGGKRRDMGLGGYPDVTLAAARERARQLKEQIDTGVDIIMERRSRRLDLKAANMRKILFRDAAVRCHLKESAEFKSDVHARQWMQTLETYAFPVIGDLNVDEITMEHIRDVLSPIWQDKTETATRVRQRIEVVLTWATVSGYRSGENVARWQGHLAAVLPSPAKLKKLRGDSHHAAMHYRDVPRFMAHLRQCQGLAARALEFLILTAARSGEVRHATWIEMDTSRCVWTVPAMRMKAAREHRIPLTDEAISILAAGPRFLGCDIVFPSVRSKVPLTSTGLSKPLKEYAPEFTVHGFRSAFRDWISETTQFPGAVAEMALAHSIGDKTEAAYRRGDLFDKRISLMATWSEYCYSWVGGQVVPLQRQQQ